MLKSDFTLKNHKQMRGMDGYVYSGILLHKGAQVCTYFDDGNGGGMILRFSTPAIEAEFTAFIASLPPSPSEYFPDGLEESADGFIEEIIVKRETEAKLKRALKKHTVFRLKGDNEGDFRTLSGGIYSKSSHDWLVNKFGDKIDAIYNSQGDKLSA